MLKIIEKLFDDYIEKVAKTYGHSVNDLKRLMNDEDTTTIPLVNIPTQVQPQLIAATGTGGLCSFVLLRGARAGTVCGAKNKKNSDFCCQHSKKNVTEKEIVVIETNNKALPPKKPNPVLRMNKIIGKWWHPDSGLVFKSSEEKIVIGIFKNNQLVDLSEEDVQACVAHKFKYVYNKRKREEEDEGENDVIIFEHKKQKIIDEEFIKVNQDAKNVEVLIKEMFNKPGEGEEEEDDDIEEENDPIPDWLNDGAEETKENYAVVEENIDDAVADEEEEEDFGDLSEEEDCMDDYD